MVGGQYIDVAGTAPGGADGLRRLHELKTGRLIGASIECVLLLDGDRDDLPQSRRFRAFAERAGRAVPDRRRHPRRDRIEETLGKQQGSDERLGKRTYVTEFGLDGARRLAEESPRAGARGARRRRARGTPTSSSRSPTSSRPGATDDRTSWSTIDRPQDLHGLTDEQLQQVAQEVREHIIDTVGEIGGHFGANLGRLRDRRRAALAARLAARQDPLGRRPPGLPAQDPHRPPRPAARRSASTAAWRRSARSPSPSTTSWAPATPRPRSATRSGSRRRCAAATARTATSSRSSATAR